MKLFIQILTIIFSVFTLSCASMDAGPKVVRKEVKDVPIAARKSDDSAPRKRLMILPFLDADKDRPQDLRDKARSAFIKDLNRTGELVVIDSRELTADYSKLIENGEYNLKEVAKSANNIGVAALLEGKVIDIKVKRLADEVGLVRQMKTKFECIVRVRMVATRTGRELLNNLKTVTLEEANYRVAESVDADRFLRTNPELIESLVKDSFLEFTPQILSSLDKISWEGRVAMVNGDRIFLNVGRVSGLQLGDILRVMEDGEDIYDPETGNHIGKSPGRLKGTLEVVGYFGHDGAVAIVHSGSGFKENDKIELY